MKRLIWLLMLPLAALAGVRDDHAQQWPLALERAGAGAYRVLLEAEVYRRIDSRLMQDLDVLNANGAPVPAALFAPEQPLAQAPRLVPLPLFALPANPASGAPDVTVISERNADGSVRSITTRTVESGAAPAMGGEWLVDASALREPVRALHVDWPAGPANVNTGYRVEGSDDLRSWRVLNPRGQLVDLAQGGQRLRQDRIEVGAQMRYLRLVPIEPAAALALGAVRAELAPLPQDQAWRWEPVDGRRVRGQDGSVGFEYRVTGRFPIQRVDLVLPPNATGRWLLESRDAADAPWQPAAGPWLAFRIEGEAAAAGEGPVQRATASRSPPQPLFRLLRDREWRLTTSGRKLDESAAPPQLRLGWRAETVVFLAQGEAPFALVAGSARARRADAPIAQLVDALRSERGADWQPAPASLGAPEVLAGVRALQPTPAPRDWKSWLLWAVLAVAAMVVAGFAVSLLRGEKTT